MPLLRPMRSFGAKLTLLVTLTTGSAVISVSAVLAIIDYLDTEAETSALAGAQANIIAVNSEAPLAFGDPELGAEALSALKASPNVASATLYSADGRIFARYDNPSMDAPGFPPGQPGIRYDGTWLIVSADVGGRAGNVGRLQVVFDRSGALARAWGNVGVILTVAVMTMVFAFLISSRIGQNLVRPVDTLAATARRVSETRDYSIRAAKYGEDELGQFTDVFNEMLAQIQKQDVEIQRAHDERQRLLESERDARIEVERASRMKDEFVATLSHELRTPLSAILGWAHMLRSGDRPAQEVSHGMEVIERNARVQTQIIEDLLDMSRIVAGKLRLDVQQVTLPEVIEAAVTTVRPAAEAKGIRLQTILDPGIGPVRGDPNRLQQIVWNLLSNAIKFTGRDGRVLVALERVNSHVEISVTDTGQGIAPEFLPYVFERFRQEDGSTTRRHSGLGLGLAIVKQLVELHGGSVRAKSAGEDKGSTFVVELPLMPMHEEQSPSERAHPRLARGAAPIPHDVSLSNLHVMVVDDDADARELIGQLLEDHGARVTRAASAAEALDLFRRQPPDVLLSDIGMPDRDGYDLIRSLRKMEMPSGHLTPAVALTAFARSEDRTRAMLAGYQMHLSKPVEASELIATVAAVARLPLGR
ncbi:MAG TPA: ATP-binding protein [Candidatus Limnocylindrales bacterium]|nr:ATP-binding protein [Candidatus Limnocylindrales bacterium]